MNKSEVLPTIQSLRADPSCHRIAARVRILLNMKDLVWAARGEQAVRRRRRAERIMSCPREQHVWERAKITPEWIGRSTP
jgi:hypothetical protein